MNCWQSSAACSRLGRRRRGARWNRPRAGCSPAPAPGWRVRPKSARKSRSSRAPGIRSASCLRRRRRRRRRVTVRTVPEPARRWIRPSAWRSCNARATVGRETRNVFTSCASLGSRSAGPYFPAEMSAQELPGDDAMLRFREHGQKGGGDAVAPTVPSAMTGFSQSCNALVANAACAFHAHPLGSAPRSPLFEIPPK